MKILLLSIAKEAHFHHHCVLIGRTLNDEIHFVGQIVQDTAVVIDREIGFDTRASFCRNIGPSSKRTHPFITEINYGLLTIHWDDRPVSNIPPIDPHL